MKWKFNWAFQREDCYIICESKGAEEKARELIKNSFGKEADAWLIELEKVSKEAFLGMKDMNGDFTIGIIVYSKEPPLPKVNDIVQGMTALLMEGMNHE